MRLPNTHEQLADAIEDLVTSYLDEVRRSAKEALERSLSTASKPRRVAPRKSVSKAKHTQVRRRATKRRSATELDGLCTKLHQLVSARPGESMVVFAEELGEAVRDLQRPMAKLKADSRVRSVGERSMMRYFPMVSRVAKSAG